ncbi:ABC transporter ATP-binding protein [Streptomyces sp. NPDC013181]|uniref:ABC transporter ATP-binding protein n=1 Tax=Streptomyces sp. NPDC013181 TaxID=3364864 RepID=UPI0036CB26C5
MPLKFDSCTFRYRRRSRPVLSNLDLDFSSGHTVLLGPNGAGKSTLLALGANAVIPTSGSVRYKELNPAERRDAAAYRSKVSWLPQRSNFLPGMTCREHVAYVGWLKGLKESDAWRAAAVAIERVGLTENMNIKVKALSGGQQQRIAIAQAIAHSAELLLLDEPTVGLDPHQRRRFLDLISSLRGSAHVIVSTHDIGDLDNMFDEVVVLEAGRTRFRGSVDAFAQHAAIDSAPERRLESAYASLLEATE